MKVVFEEDGIIKLVHADGTMFIGISQSHVITPTKHLGIDPDSAIIKYVIPYLPHTEQYFLELMYVCISEGYVQTLKYLEEEFHVITDYIWSEDYFEITKHLNIVKYLYSLGLKMSDSEVEDLLNEGLEDIYNWIINRDRISLNEHVQLEIPF